MSEHQERADDLEAEADQLEKRNEHLGEEISDLKENWEAMRRDESVPGAPAPESGLPPEANYTTRGDQPPEGPGDDE
jgi:chromosome segregation ATPase